MRYLLCNVIGKFYIDREAITIILFKVHVMSRYYIMVSLQLLCNVHVHVYVDIHTPVYIE